MTPINSGEATIVPDACRAVNLGEAGASGPGIRVRNTQDRIVLFVTSTPGYGGSEKHLLELTSRLCEGDIRPIILCAKEDPFTERLTCGCETSVSVRRETDLKSILAWIRIFRKIRPDVVVLIYGTLYQIPWYASVAVRLAGIRRLYGIQHSIPLWTPPPHRGRGIRAQVRRLASRVDKYLSSIVPPFLCDKIICVSNATRESLIRQYRFPPEKTLAIHNGVSLAEFSPREMNSGSTKAKLGMSADETVLVCVTRLSGEKGVDILLQAVSRLVDKKMSFKCLIVGDGPLMESLSAQVRSLHLTQHVSMEGFREDVRPYLLAADVFVLTSYVEGLPYAVLEAMACGVPCVVTNVGGNAEAITHNINGLVVTPGSADEVAEAISFLLTHPHERAKMAHSARLRACEEFDIDAKMATIKRVILD